jgi:hypothetical protein
LVGCSALAIFVVGCAGISGAPETRESVVKARAQERWNALLAGRFDKAYEFITPSGRSTLPMETYRGRLSAVTWRSAKVTAVACEPEVCEVTVVLDIDVLPNLPHQQPISEKWLLDGGKWWFVYRG